MFVSVGVLEHLSLVFFMSVLDEYVIESLCYTRMRLRSLTLICFLRKTALLSEIFGSAKPTAGMSPGQMATTSPLVARSRRITNTTTHNYTYARAHVYK